MKTAHHLIVGFVCVSILMSMTGCASTYKKGNQAYKEGNYEEAIAYWTEAANQGVFAAARNLAKAYYLGEHVSKDVEKSKYWLQKHANEGDYLAAFWLAEIYEEEQNHQKVQKWLERGYFQATIQGKSNHTRIPGLISNDTLGEKGEKIILVVEEYVPPESPSTTSSQGSGNKSLNQCVKLVQTGLGKITNICDKTLIYDWCDEGATSFGCHKKKGQPNFVLTPGQTRGLRVRALPGHAPTWGSRIHVMVCTDPSVPIVDWGRLTYECKVQRY